MQLVYFLISNLIIFHSIIKETRKLNIYIYNHISLNSTSIFSFLFLKSWGIWSMEMWMGQRPHPAPWDKAIQALWPIFPAESNEIPKSYIYIYGSTQRYVHLLSEPSHETPCRPTMWFHLCWLQGINIWIILKSNHLNWPRILEHLYGRWYVYTRSNSG